jgi:NAD(P)-dependent dehydrogenase (short-subunit alcohol dehydrogenase family)
VSRLEGRTAIVTGASANIGGALAAGLAADGARVVCTDADRMFLPVRTTSGQCTASEK